MYKGTESMGEGLRAFTLSRPMEYCLRIDLPGAMDARRICRERLDVNLWGDIKDYDPTLELIWQPYLDRWVMYKVTRRGVVPSEDMLSYQFKVTGPNGEFREPGYWLINWMKMADTWKGGALTPEKGAEAHQAKLDSWIKEAEDDKDREYDDLSREFGKDLANAITERHLVAAPDYSIGDSDE